MIRGHCWRLGLVGAMLATGAMADDVIFRNGRALPDVEVKSIENGQIEFTYGEPEQVAKTALSNVQAIRPAGASFRIARFVEHTEDKDTGRLLEIELLTDRQRLREPLVRVFVMMEDARGERELHLYQNQKVRDPTALYDLPVINRAGWRPARYFVEVEHKAVAWHVEIWQDGTIALDQELGKRQYRRKWWLLQKPDRSSRLEIPESAAEVLGDVEGVRAVIRNARVHRGLQNDRVRVDCEWALETDKDRLALPDATFYYVLENAKGEREIKDESVATDAGEEVRVQAGKVVRSNTIELDDGVVIAGGGTALVGDDNENAERLIYWRFEVHVGDAVLAVRESPNTAIRRSLGDNWWRK